MTVQSACSLRQALVLVFSVPLAPTSIIQVLLVSAGMLQVCGALDLYRSAQKRGLSSDRLNLSGRFFASTAWCLSTFPNKHFKLNVPSYSEVESSGEDWNVCCHGILTLDRETSTATID